MPGEIHVTGNTGIDALLAAETRLPPAHPRERGVPRILVTCHRRESWGEGLKSIAAALIELAADHQAHIDVMLHPNPYIAQTIAALLDRRDGIALIDPCGHGELVGRIRDSDLVLSDSGGIQEEAPALGTPLLVLRDKTERPEGLVIGNARLIGTSTEMIVRHAGALIRDLDARAAMARRAFPYGDGRASPRIAAIIERWLERRSLRKPLSRRGAQISR